MHPEIQDFSNYDLIIDARSPKEYREDHIPAAINLPVVNDEEYAEVGTLHRTDKMGAYRIGANYSLINIARYIEEELPKHTERSRILVYCFRGGKRSKIWVDVLEAIGYKVDKLPGGWKNYRRWVNQQLEHVPTLYKYNVLSGPTGCGKTRLLAALRQANAQVLDLEALASHRGSVLGTIPGVGQPSQKYFDTLLLHQLSQFDPARPIWVEAENKKIGNVQLPISLLTTMRGGLTIQIETAMSQRVALLREDYQHFEDDPQSMMKRLQFLRPLIGGAEFSIWEELAAERRIPELFERLMRNHYDPAYRRSILRNYPAIDASPLITLADLSPAGLLPIARLMQDSFEK